MLVFLHPSSAVQVTSVVPRGKTEPDGWLHEKRAEQLSVIFGFGYVTLAPVGSVPCAICSAGHRIDGASTSATIATNEQTFSPESLRAAQRTRVRPTGKSAGETTTLPRAVQEVS